MQEATNARKEVHSLQTQLMQRDAELERRTVELDVAKSDKSSLEKLLREKEADVNELRTRLKSISEKVLVLTKTNAELDSKLHEAQVSQSRATLNLTKVQQEKEILEKGNKWLYDELEQKSNSSNEERRKATESILELQRKVHEMENKLNLLQKEHDRLLEQNEAQKKDLERRAQEIREMREESASKEESFEKELAMVQRMAQLYRESAEEHGKRSSELEGIVKELQSHIEVTEASHREAVEKLESARSAAEARANEEKALRERVVAAATATGQGSPAPGATPSPMSEASNIPVSPGAAEMYSKYVEMHEKWRTERLKSRQSEIVLEELLLEVERRAAAVKEQQEEYENLKSAYDKLSGRLEVLAAEKRSLESQSSEAEATARRSERETRMLEQQVKDLSQQVARLLFETQAGVQAGSGAGGQFSGGDASDVTTQLLVEFKDIEELQQQNQRLLRVNRELAQAAEATKAEAEEALRRDYEAQLQRLANELDDIRSNREQAEQLLEQVQRQRDTLRELLSGGDKDLASARSAYARSLLESDAGVQTMAKDIGGGATPSQPGNGAALELTSSAENHKYRDLYLDLESQFKQFKEDTDKNQTMLTQDLAQAKEDATTARSEAARCSAQAEFESERSKRLANTLDAQRGQLENLMASNAKYQTLITETEQRLIAAQAAAAESQDNLRRLNMQVEALKAEKQILASAESRLSQDVAELSKERFKLAAELEAKEKMHTEREEELSKEALRLREELVLLKQANTEMEREVTTERLRAESSARAAEYAEAKGADRISRLEEDLRESQQSLSTAQQRVSSAEAKVDMLQEALRKAEERVARLEMEKSSRLTTSDVQASAPALSPIATPAPGNREAELLAEVKLLREELATMQEAAVSATGHAKQFEMLARTAEEALKSVQNDHEKFKQEAAARVEAHNKKIEEIQAALSAKEAEIREAKQAEKEFAAECERLDKEFAAERKSIQEALEQAKQEREQEGLQLKVLTEDMDRLRGEVELARRSYDAEVVAHGEALRRLSASDTALATLQERLNAVNSDLEMERNARREIESQLRSQIQELDANLRVASKQAQDLGQQRDVLQEQLEKLASSSGADAGDFSNTLRLLRQEREAAQINLSLAERELVRLRQEAVVARRAAEEARAQLAAEAERTRNAMRDETSQEEILQRVEQFNLLRESNAALRTDNLNLRSQVQELQTKIKDAERALVPLQQKLHTLEAAQETAKRELTTAREQTERWQKRTQQLMQKYESVDVGEYQRVNAELKAAQQALKDNEAKISELGQQVKTLEQQARTKSQETDSAEGGLRDQVSKLTSELQSVKTEMETHRKRAITLWSAICNTCNLEKKPLAEWKALQVEKERRLKQLEEKEKVMQMEGESGPAKSSAEVAGLKAKVTQLEADVAAANERAAQEIKAAKVRQLELAKKAAAGKQAVVRELETAKQQLESAKEAELAAKQRVETLEAEQSALNSTIANLSEEVAVCHKRVRELEGKGKKSTGVPTLAHRQAISKQAEASTKQAAEESKARPKRKIANENEEAEDDKLGTEKEPVNSKKTRRLNINAPDFVLQQPVQLPVQQEKENPAIEVDEDHDIGAGEAHEEVEAEHPSVQEKEKGEGEGTNPEEGEEPEGGSQVEYEGEEEAPEMAPEEQEEGEEETFLEEEEEAMVDEEEEAEGEQEEGDDEEGEFGMETEVPSSPPYAGQDEVHEVHEHVEEPNTAEQDEENDGAEAGEHSQEEMEHALDAEETHEGKEEEADMEHDGQGLEGEAVCEEGRKEGDQSKLEIKESEEHQAKGTIANRPKRREPIAWVPPPKEAPSKTPKKSSSAAAAAKGAGAGPSTDASPDTATPIAQVVQGRGGPPGRGSRGGGRAGARGGRGRGRTAPQPPPSAS